MSRMGRRGMQRGLDHGSDFLLGNARNATWSWCILTQPRQTEGEKTFSPELDRRSGNSQCLRDVIVEDTLAGLAGVITAYQGNTLHEKGLTTLLDELESLSDAAAKRLVGKINSTVSPKLFVLLGNLSIGSRPFEQVRLTWMLAEREYCNGRCFSMRWNWRRSQSGEPKPRA
jgi:hypothetical protein